MFGISVLSNMLCGESFNVNPVLKPSWEIYLPSSSSSFRLSTSDFPLANLRNLPPCLQPYQPSPPLPATLLLLITFPAIAGNYRQFQPRTALCACLSQATGQIMLLQ